jgi:hypothetical protein
MWWLKPAVYLIGAMTLFGYGYYAGHHKAQATWELKWEARDAAEATAVAQAKVAAEAAEAAHKARDTEVVNDLQKQLTGARSNADSLARRLRLAAGTRGCGAVSDSIPATAGAHGAGDGDACAARIEQRTADVFQAAEVCAATLTAWQKRGR